MVFKRFLKYILIVVFAAVFLPSYPVEVYDGEGFEKAYSAPDTNNVIELEADIKLSNPLNSPAGQTTEIRGKENKYTLDGAGNSGIILNGGKTLNVEGIKAKNFKSEIGGFIYNVNGSIDHIEGEFNDNYASQDGGAIQNSSFINKIKGKFENNSAELNGGAIYNHLNADIETIDGVFNKNRAKNSVGGAIVNFGNIGTIKGSFNQNSSDSGWGGAIANYNHISKIEGIFENNYSHEMGGAIQNSGTINDLNADFINNKTESLNFAGGGAIANFGNIDNLTGVFKNNKTNGLGGAIYNSSFGTINITSNDRPVEFSGNTDSSGNRGIYNDGGTINFNAGEYDITLNDKISGSPANIQNSVINLNGNSTGKIIINNDVSNSVMNMNGGILQFGESQGGYYGNFDKTVNFNYNGGKIDLRTGCALNTNLGNLTLNSDLDLKIDLDLNGCCSDTFSVNSFTSNGHSINVSYLEPLGATKEKRIQVCPLGDTMEDEHLRDLLSQSVNYTGEDIVDTPIYKYKASFDHDNCTINLSRIDELPDYPVSAFNPAIMTSSVASRIGGYLSQLNSYDEAFRNMSMYMIMPKSARLNFLNQNRLAAKRGTSLITGLPYLGANYWLRPYSYFEKVPLKYGYKVANISYGAFAGAESGYKDLRHGWGLIWGPYAGYSGSHQTFYGNGIYQHGGNFGLVGGLYKGNFFGGLTANAGGSECLANTAYGSDSFEMILGGAALKTGYNIEFFDGKFIAQPNYLMSYTFVNTLNYTNAAHVRVRPATLNAFQIAPGMIFIGNLKKWCQPYLEVRVVWNIMNKNRFMANDVALPWLGIHPFVMYGGGVRKKWGENIFGYLQAFALNGGRQGAGIQIGFSKMF